MARPSLRRPINKSNRNHTLWAVRCGRQRGSFQSWYGPDGARSQVDGYSGSCHLGFTQRQVRLGIHLKYLQGEYGSTGPGESRQIRKIREGRVPSAANGEQSEADSDTEDEDAHGMAARMCADRSDNGKRSQAAVPGGSGSGGVAALGECSSAALTAAARSAASGAGLATLVVEGTD